MDLPMQTTPESQKKSFTWLLVLILLFLVAVLGFLVWKIYSLKSEPIPVASPSVVESIPGWETYTSTNSADLYQIQYPGNWLVEQLPSGVSFGPKEIDDGTIWSVLSYDKTYTQDIIISDIDKFLTDKVQKTETISINGVNAVQVVTTSPSKVSFRSVTIIIDAGTSNIVISDSGMKEEELNAIIGGAEEITFEKFYSTFKFLN
jgi:hypothetical protein